MTPLKTLAVVLALALCSSLSVAEGTAQGVSGSNTTTSGYPTTTPPTTVPPYSSGPTLPPVGQNCHTVKVCISVTCTAYDSQGKCAKQECTAWEDRVICK